NSSAAQDLQQPQPHHQLHYNSPQYQPNLQQHRPMMIDVRYQQQQQQPLLQQASSRGQGRAMASTLPNRK
ncbi:hypothetical protein BOX15_Mlig033423g2, partial [Macrostomum lignano]